MTSNNQRNHPSSSYRKGIQSPEDAVIAISAGADGIWVSNHGGRQLDGGPASFEVLPKLPK